MTQALLRLMGAISEGELSEIMGANMRRIREEKKVSLEDLAEAMELSPGLLALYERGRRGFTAYVQHQLLMLLGITAEQLYQGV